ADDPLAPVDGLPAGANSTPPVGTITVVLPALRASRTSIQVNSSTNTLSRASMGRGVFGSGRVAVGWAARNPTASKTTSSPQDRDICFVPLRTWVCSDILGYAAIQQPAM